MSNIQFSLVTSENGQKFVTVYADGKLTAPVGEDHPNFKAIIGACTAAFEGDSTIDAQDVLNLFDVPKAISRAFERLSERVTVEGNTVLFDGDPVHGTLQEQILAFLDAGEDFAPLVEFYEKLTTNPLGDVRDGLYDFINGQRAEGNFTITPEGDVLGYKSVQARTPEWRKDQETVYTPSRRGIGRVNDVDVKPDQYIEQVPGDVVEMPRSKVLHAPSQACGDGLHIGTWAYAKTFTGDTVMLVKFSPRDIVSMPDSNATWKLRVCRYTVIGPVTEPLEVPVYSPKGQENPDVEYGDNGFEDDLDFDVSLDEDRAEVSDSEGNGVGVGDRVTDFDGDEGVVTAVDEDDNEVTVKYDDAQYGTITLDGGDVTVL